MCVSSYEVAQTVKLRSWLELTRLPMLITDTPSKPSSKISLDFVGPKEPTEAGNQYILTIQDNFSKYCILAPVKQATAEEVTQVLTNKVISYFGPQIRL